MVTLPLIFNFLYLFSFFPHENGNKSYLVHVSIFPNIQKVLEVEKTCVPQNLEIKKPERKQLPQIQQQDMNKSQNKVANKIQ